MSAAVVSAVVVVAAVVGYSPTPGPYQLVNRGSVDNHVAVIGDSYTTGTDEGGRGPRSWTAQTWEMLAAQGLKVDADVVAEGGAGYGVRGNNGSVFEDLTVTGRTRDDVLVVFFGSRNDQPVNPTQFPGWPPSTFHLAQVRRTGRKDSGDRAAVADRDPPPAVLTIRNSLRAQAAAIGATFIDPIDAGWFVGRPDPDRPRRGSSDGRRARSTWRRRSRR